MISDSAVRSCFLAVAEIDCLTGLVLCSCSKLIPEARTNTSNTDYDLLGGTVHLPADITWHSDYTRMTSLPIHKDLWWGKNKQWAIRWWKYVGQYV